MLRLLSRFFDIRAGEGRIAAQSFAVLFLVITGHTMLETARDALFLSQLPPSQLNLVYVALAGLTFVVAALSTRFSSRFGRRNALVCTLLVFAYMTTWIHALPKEPRVALGLYLFSGVVGAVLAPQFWLLASHIFTVAQGRRLFGPIASGGVIGGVVGAGTAALMLTRYSVSSLLPVSAALFVMAALVVTTVQLDQPAPSSRRGAKPDEEKSTVLFRSQPFLLRIGALVALSTAAVLVVDYLFKSTVAQNVPKERLGEFFARCYAAMNGVSLLVQLLLAGRIVRRAGVIGAAAIMPLLLVFGGASIALVGGGMLLVLATKGVDGGLRYSLNRVSTELLYLPLPQIARERGKSFIDSVLGRVVQAVSAAVLFVLATRQLATPRLLAEIIAGLSVLWLAVALGLRKPYLDLFRRALGEGTLGESRYGDELDLASAEILVEKLASRDAVEVIAAMTILEQHGRGKLVPALVLYHEDEAVLRRALELLSTSARSDWTALAERLLADPREAVRVAAVRALGRAGVVSALVHATDDISSRVQAYATLLLAERRTEGDLAEDPQLMVMVQMPGELGVAGRFGLLAAIADSPDPRATELLRALADKSADSRSAETIALVAQAMGRMKDPRFIPYLIERLAYREGRDAVRDALVTVGEPALDALIERMQDPTESRRVRMHLPRTISRFGTQRACDFLVAQLEREESGLVRYKVLRGLGRMVTETDVKVSRPRVEAVVKSTLIEYLQLLSLRVAVSEGGEDGPASVEARRDASGRLVVGLLDDKLAQGLERAFRLLQIAYRREDLHRVHAAALSSDKRLRANAGEFLDVLLAGREEQTLRALLRLVTDDLEPAERVARAAPFLTTPAPKSREEALTRLLTDRDETLAALAAHHALALGEGNLPAAVANARKIRPSIDAVGGRLFGSVSSMVQEPVHA